ncbi:30S ribosomal protein S20 [Coprothermobacter platensis]|uniref:30S ribosomal protein S20 n=1 Tax=Coprothermobacter platensis TaxID=108819 RepID=UPI0003735465|nr:30S ribosomal protein S20 [Coprothermobacter platensis]
MANTISAKRRIRLTQKETAYNRYWRTTMRTYVKKAKKAIEAGDRQAAQEAVLKAQGILDKVAVKGVIHKNEAARRKSRLMKLFNEKFSDTASKAE